MSTLNLSLPKGTNRIVAIVAGLMVVAAGMGMLPSAIPGWIVPVLGAFMGFFAVKDAKAFLLAGLALIAAKWGLQYVPFIGSYIEAMATELVRLVAPAMLVVSVRNIYDQLKD